MPYQRTKPPTLGAKAPFPGFVEPALATKIGKVPSGERWIHEIKFDGYRVQLHIVNEAHKIFTRLGNDWTTRFRKIAADAYLINARSAIIDGEVVVPSADGTTDFSVLQNELKGRSDKIVMVAFDLLYWNGQDLRKVPLVERKAALKKLIAKTPIQYSESFELDGGEMFKHTHAWPDAALRRITRLRREAYASSPLNKRGRLSRWRLAMVGQSAADNTVSGGTLRSDPIASG
jgi:bifunctional non-homologous end joining protein LigD